VVIGIGSCKSNTYNHDNSPKSNKGTTKNGPHFCCSTTVIMTNHQVCNNRNMTGATIGAVDTYPSAALSLTQLLIGFVLLKFSVSCFVEHCLSFCTL
jgi:hypothetical protein